MAAPKILVVDDDPNIQRVLVFALKQEGFEVQVASDGRTGVEMAIHGHPDLILMDVHMPRLDGYAATEKIRAAESGRHRVPIILLTAGGDVAQRVRGLRAGADDEIVKPFHPLELMARINALLARGGDGTGSGRATQDDAAPLGRLCVLYGAKGGVGTTTIAINAAIALVRDLKRRVALIDANLQFGDTRVFLDMGLDKPSIVNAITETDLDADLLRKLMVRHHTGIEVLLAPPSPETADLVAERQRQDPGALSRLLNLTRHMYDYTLVDMVKTIDDLNLQLFDEADQIFVVMSADLSCVKNVRLMLEMMDSLGYERSKVQLVLNRSDAYTGINVNNVESALNRAIDHQIINDYRGAIGALNSGEPFMSSRPDSPLGRNVSAFSKALDSKLVAEAAASRTEPRKQTLSLQ